MEQQHVVVNGTEQPLTSPSPPTPYPTLDDDALMPAIATLLATIPVSLVSYAHDTFSDRASNGGLAHKPTDDAITALWFISIVLALFSVILRRQATSFTSNSLTASVITLLAGLIIFSWAEQPRAVSIPFTVVVGCIMITAAFCS